MPNPTPQRIPSAQERLGAANELIAQVCDPASALNLGERITPGYLVERLREHLAREAGYQTAAGWSQPAVYGEASLAVQTAMASMIPWPAHATGGLWRGDAVDHEIYGAGRVSGFDNDQWAAVIHLVAGGHILVRFEDGAEHWVAAPTCTRAEPAAPCVDQRSPF